MHVDAEPCVVGEVIAIIIRVWIKHDIVAIPQPTVDETYVCRSDAEEEATKPEAVRTAAFNSPNTASADFTGKMAVLPGMIQVIARIVSPLIMSHPAIIRRIDVRRLRMPGSVIKFAVILRWLIVDGSVLRHSMRGTNRTTSWNVPAANFWAVITLISSLGLTAVLVSTPGLTTVLVSTTTSLLGNHEC